MTADERIVLLFPPATLIFPQSATACLLAVALALLITRYDEYRAIFSAIPALMRSPLAITFGLFLLWVDVSCLWSPVPEASAIRLLKTLMIAGATVIVLAVAATETLSGDRSMRFLSFMAVLCAGLTAILTITYPEIAATLGLPYSDRQLLRIALVLALLLPFIMSYRRYSPALRAALCAPLVVAVFMTTNETAKLAILVAIVTSLAAAIAWRTTLYVIAGISLALTFLMPLLLASLQSAIPARLVAMLADAHAAERLAIWRQHALLIPLRPLHGWGLESSRVMIDYVDPETLAELNITPVFALHPHNHILQIWLEFGAVGIVLFTAVMVALFYRINAMPPSTRSATLSLFATFFAIGIVGHGLWQSWWLALLGALLVVVLSLERRERQMPDEALPDSAWVRA